MYLLINFIILYYYCLLFIYSYYLDIGKEQLFSGFEITKQKELKVVDKDIIKRYDGLMSEMIKKIAQSLSEGRGLIGVSLPVRIFEPRSTIERIGDKFGYLVNYLSNKLCFEKVLSNVNNK